MRGHDVHFKYYRRGELVQNINTICWAGVMSFYTQIGTNLIEPKEIYIFKYETEETRKYVELLINIINEITPCSLQTINTINYIKFKVLDTYDQSLILLSFIRNLWHGPKDFISNKKYIDYTSSFFQELEESKSKDPLSKLMDANRKACKKAVINQWTGHSNAGAYDSLKVKSVQDLLKYKNPCTAGSVQRFFTS